MKIKNHRNNDYKSFIKYGIAFYKRTCRAEMKINGGIIQEPSKDFINTKYKYDENNDNGGSSSKVSGKNKGKRRGRGRGRVERASNSK